MSLLLRSLVLCVCLFAGLAQTGCQTRSARNNKAPTNPVSTASGKPPVEIPVAKPLVPTPPIPDSSGSWYQPRAKWTQQSIVVSRTKPMGGTPNVITVHHSGDKDDIHTESAEWLRQVDLNHIKGTGHAEPWACIGYHFIIDVSGKVYEGRPLKYQGAHAGNDQVNKLNIGICLIGDFDQARVPAAQRTALLSTLDRLCLQYDINRTSVYGHKHFKSTECPGRYLSQIIASYTQRPAETAEPTRKQAVAPRAASRLGTVTPAHK